MRLLILAGAVILTGCIGMSPDEAAMWPYSKTGIHLHNIWHEFLPDREFILHWTIVNTIPEDQKRIWWSTMITSRATPELPAEDAISGGGRIEMLLREMSSAHSWTTRLTEPPASYFRYDISIESYTSRSRYRGACFRPSDGHVVATGGYRFSPCDPRYYVNGWDLTAEATPIHWSDPQFQRLVYDCCGVRTLPAYDVHQTFETNRTGLVDLSWRFPAQEGARNATVAVSFTLPTNSPGPGILNVTVLGPDDETVAAATTLLDPVRIEIPSLRQGTYKVHVDGQLVPYSDVFLTIHVDDGVQDRAPKRPASAGW